MLVDETITLNKKQGAVTLSMMILYFIDQKQFIAFTFFF